MIRRPSTRAELRRALVDFPDNDPWQARAILESHLRNMALRDLGVAYRRRVRVRGRGTMLGVRLAIARFRRWRMGSPMFGQPRRPEARA